MTTAITAAQRWLDQTGMYRVVTLSLVVLAATTLLFSLLSSRVTIEIGSYTFDVAYSFYDQIRSLIVAVGVAVGLNVAIARLAKIPANHESAVITALILFFLFAPVSDWVDLRFIAAASAVAIASKFLLAPRRQHIVNAAAIGAVALSTPQFYEAWWWVAQPEWWIILVLCGAVVVTKVRRWPMVMACLAAGFTAFVFDQVILQEADMLSVVERYFVTGPMLFLVFFMLTEPFTTPPTERLQVAYGVLVGVLANLSILTGWTDVKWLTMTPELALVVGNLAFYPFTLRQKLYLKLAERRHIADATYEFIFEKPAGMRWQPGQYLEWMLPHSADSRGPRRYFTIGSSPEEQFVLLALRVMSHGGSSYKRQLMDMKPGESLIASQLAGDFLLPRDTSKKLAFIAGGIGVTPFRSHFGHMLAANEQRDVHFYYCNKFAKDIAYHDLFKRVEAELGVRWVNVLSDEEAAGCEHGFLTQEMLERITPDYKERTWYLSGPPGMVNAYTKLLVQSGVATRQIVTDFFPGLA